MFKQKIKEKLAADIRRLKDRRGFVRAGLPRFGRLFGRDSLIVSWQLLDFDPGIAKKTLRILSETEGRKFDRLREEEPGKILHETNGKTHPERPAIPFPYYGSVDSTPLFIIVFWFYCRKTGDFGFARKHWPNIKKAVLWMINFGDADGDLFLEYERKNPCGLFHQGWKDAFRNHLKIKPPAAVVEAQGYQYLALRAAAGFGAKFNEKDFSRKLKRRAARLKEKFNRRFWWKKEKYFYLGLDGKKKPRRAVTSNPGHLLFTGILGRGRAKAVVRRLFRPDMFTEFGIRTHSAEEKDFAPRSYHLGSVWPHDNWIIYRGLKKSGFRREAEKIKKALLGVYEHFGCIPELYGVAGRKIVKIPNACAPQGWASAALLDLLRSPD